MKIITAFLSLLLMTSTVFATEAANTTIGCFVNSNTGFAKGSTILGLNDGKYITESVLTLDAKNELRLRANLEQEGQRITVRIYKGAYNQPITYASGGIDRELMLDIEELDISVSCHKIPTQKD